MRRLIYLSACLSLTLFTACHGRQAHDPVPDPAKTYPFTHGDSLIQGTIADPAILNPVLASDSASFAVTGLVFNSLLRYDKNLNLEGELAERWEVSPDGKLITFHLRKNITFHDGQPLTAADVQFTLETYLNPKVKTAYRSNYTSISKFKALDALTFRVWYQEPFAPALQSLAGMSILPKHLLADKDINTADAFNNHPIGSGPYVFKSWKRAEAVTLESNPHYFEGRPGLQRLIFRIIPDMSVQYLELQNGALDTMDLTPSQFNREGNQPAFLQRFNKYRYLAPQYTYLGFNLKNPLFQDIRVRRAIGLAINRQALVDSVLEGLGTVGTGPYTPSSWAYPTDARTLPFDPAAAKQLLMEAGFTYTPDGRLQKNGKSVAFTILTNQGNLNREQTATIIQAQLKAIGMDVQIRIIAWSSLLSEFINKRKFDALIMGWSLAQDPDLFDIWHSSKTGEFEFNHVSYVNPQVDALLVEGRRTFDPARRIAVYRQVHALIAADLPYIFLYVPDSLVTVHRRVLGIKVEKAGISYNFIKWFVPREFQKYPEQIQ
ncbi:MAG: peptide-binding protein [Candidatus Firestonebacteria bacterium]|nr:peptide-binding protein [Candidatus Firestonebacteria bacterium]